MTKRIWITKGWKNACTVTIWTEKPVWYPNTKFKQPHDSGYWGRKDDGSLRHSSCTFHDELNNFFKVAFTKNPCEGYIAERILTLEFPKKEIEQ